MKNETARIIEARVIDSKVDEEVARILEPKPKRLTATWSEIAAPTEAMKIVACQDSIPDARGYVYPMGCEIKMDLKQPSPVDPLTKEKVSQYIEHQMLRRNQSDAVLVCETKDRVKKSRRKDKSRSAPKAQAKMIISSLNNIEQVVNDLFDRINLLINRATVDGLQVRLRLGNVNTLECFSENGEDDVFSGF